LNLKVRNKWFYNYLLPDIKTIKTVPKVDYDTNNILFRNILLYAGIGQGKTELVRSLGEVLVHKYGLENVNLMKSSDGRLDLLISNLDNKLVQVLFSDDLTSRKIDMPTLRNYLRIRHIWKEKFNRTYGFIFSILNVHRFFNTSPLLRSNLDAIIFKSCSTNPFDFHTINRFIGTEALDDLETIEMLRLNNPEYRSYSIFLARRRVGLLYLPLAKRDYFKTVKHSYQNLGIKDYSKSIVDREFLKRTAERWIRMRKEGII